MAKVVTSRPVRSSQVARGAKTELRAMIRRERQNRSREQRLQAARGLRDVFLDMPALRGARGVALYVSRPGEPGTQLLRAALAARRTCVLLPVVSTAGELSWLPDTMSFPDSPHEAALPRDNCAHSPEDLDVILVPALTSTPGAAGWGGAGTSTTVCSTPRGTGLWSSGSSTTTRSWTPRWSPCRTSRATCPWTRPSPRRASCSSPDASLTRSRPAEPSSPVGAATGWPRRGHRPPTAPAPTQASRSSCGMPAAPTRSCTMSRGLWWTATSASPDDRQRGGGPSRRSVPWSPAAPRAGPQVPLDVAEPGRRDRRDDVRRLVQHEVELDGLVEPRRQVPDLVPGVQREHEHAARCRAAGPARPRRRAARSRRGGSASTSRGRRPSRRRSPAG